MTPKTWFMNSSGMKSTYLLPQFFRGKGAMQKKVTALRELRRLLSKSEFPPIDVALSAGAIPLLVQCLSFGSPDEQVSFIGLILS